MKRLYVLFLVITIILFMGGYAIFALIDPLNTLISMGNMMGRMSDTIKERL